jgi:hypothetical protein
MKTQVGALEMQNDDNFLMQAVLYPRVLEAISAGDWVYMLAIRIIPLPTVPDSLTLACCLVRERLTPLTASTLTHTLQSLRELGLNAQESLAVIAQRYFAAEEAIRISQARSSLLIDLPWKACGHSGTDLWSHLPTLIQCPVWSLQSILLHWSQVGAPDDLLATTYQGQTPGRLWYLLLPPQWMPLDDIASKASAVTPHRPRLTRAQEILARIAQAGQKLLSTHSKASVPLPANEGHSQAPSTIVPTDQYIWRQVGDRWEIVYPRKKINVKDSIGMKYLNYLVHNPGRECSALDLMALVEGKKGTKYISEEQLQQGNLRISDGEIAYDVLDKKAIKDLKKVLPVLRDQLDEAKENHDIEEQQEIERRIHRINNTLKESLKRGGESLTFNSNKKRPRNTVYKAIKRAIDRILVLHPPLGEHLQPIIKKSPTFAYHPSSDTPSWNA